MAEAQSNFRDSGARLRRNMSKLAYRSKEMVMRSLGRTEETKDEILDHYVMLINKQQLQMQKLHRDMKHYLAALKVMSSSQKAFYNSLYEIYDDDWMGKDIIASCAQRSELLHDDISARFQAEVTDKLQSHLGEYHRCKVQVEKRGRKLIDYDAAKRSLLSLEASRKPDEAKLERAKEVASEARETYEELNHQLHEQLPSLYDSRLPICAEVFSSICESERVFSNEVAELRTKLVNVLQNLKCTFDSGEYHIQRMHPPFDNGKVAPASENLSGSSVAATAKIATASDLSLSSPAKRNTDETLPIGSRDTVAPGSPGSDPSTHEYVNLQVGTIPDTVKPVTEEEENDPKTNENKKSEYQMYLYPNVNNNLPETGYITTTDLSMGVKMGSAGVVKPKPSPRSRVFRNPSDSRPPIPKPLPRTLSAPPGERPVVKRQQKHPSLRGNWRVPRNQYTDVHPRPNNGRKTAPASSPLRDRPEFPRPDSRSPTVNGDGAAIQPIYEEPPREEGFTKPDSPSKPPPAHSSPTKSTDSQKYLDLPPNYLFSVQALYQYRSTDEDELSFEKGEIIHIMKHPDPDEQDEGWQMGIRQRDWEENADLETGMGVFPENFTKRIQL